MMLRTWLRIDRTEVTFYARNPMIIELEGSSEMEQHYIKPNKATLIGLKYDFNR